MGLYCEPKGDDYSDPLVNLYPPSPPKNRYSAGRGKVVILHRKFALSDEK
ncbi:MAG: hypothetical protein SOZ27_02430 [Spirochaetia bacterium]|nr:hypothetical protein [Spirochaetia bacterium]